MNQIIQNRINKIKKKEVPTGYKKSNGNIIPIDWEISNLGDIVTYKKGFAFKSVNFCNKGIRVIRISDTTYNSIKNDNPVYIPVECKDKYKDYELLVGDLIVSSVGSRPPLYDSMVGKVIKVPLKVDGALLNQNAIRIRVNKLHNQDYVYSHLKTKKYLYHIERSIRGNANQVSITLNDLFSFQIFLLQKLEQDKIAKILTIWDNVVELKEKLIKEKTKQKKGLMQKLLTGEVRLYGFDKAWIIFKAKDIFQNISDKRHNGEGEVLSVTQENGIVPRSEVDIDIKFDKKNLKNYKKVRKGDFVISLRSFQGGIEYSLVEGLVSPAYTILRNKIEIHKSYYKHLFKSTEFIARLNGLIYGIRDGKQIGYKDFSVLKLTVPPINEQIAIGTIIDLADDEINLLKKELAALKLQKKGLMQLLLTGIVRVNTQEI